MKKLFILIIPMLLLVPLAFALTEQEKTDLFNSIIIYSHQTGSCVNTTSSITGTATGTPTVQDLTTTNDITGSCDYDADLDDVIWTDAGALDETINYTIMYFMNDSDTNWGSVKAYGGRGTGNGGFRFERDNTANTLVWNTYDGGGSITLSGTTGVSDFINETFQLLTIRLNVTNIATGQRSLEMFHNTSIMMDASGGSGSYATTGVDYVTNDRAVTSGFASSADYAAILFINKSVNDAEIAYAVEQFGLGLHLEVGGEVDREPVAMTLINLSSDGGIGKIIYKIDVTNNKQTNVVKTNDTTPTIRIKTNKSSTCAFIDDNLTFNYTDTIAYNPSSECSTTGGSDNVSICTLTNDNSTPQGIYNFSIGCKDSNGNENLTSTSGQFLINISDPNEGVIPPITNFFLDGVNRSGKYEFGTLANISAIATSGQVEIDLNAPNYGFNFTYGNEFASFIFNISILRIWNFSNGSYSIELTSSEQINITNNNRTQIVRVSLNITSSGTTNNLNLSYLGNTRHFLGDLKTEYLINNKFLHSNVYKDAVNLTYLTAGSNFIFVNLSDIENIINLTFDISGFDLDLNNEFTYIEHFNGTDGQAGFNETLTFNASAPLGTFDDFVNNVSGRWTVTETTCSGPPRTFSYTGNSLLTSAGGSDGNQCEMGVEYSDPAAYLRNTSIVTWIYNE